ncbi:hypothetical protein BLNAU_22188 [Blattamonas nauphoetae]|uniref:Uncharacterized protein n=1 Tax=Blattamonas nauphoetae TaxID=2049346 RepID=A0ABQ9WTS6_9EUKA|nr:hypothetical protein BLNAU_22188 [Blattamonas nauphoetae]
MILEQLIWIIDTSVDLAHPGSLRVLGITAADIFSHLEMIFQKVVLPSSQFVTFLISNRNNLYGDLFNSFMVLLTVLLRICPFHRPTLEFVLASPIEMAFSSYLSFIENDSALCLPLNDINYSLGEWTEEGQEVSQSGKRMMQALFSEGFEDTLEQKLLNDKNGKYGRSVDDKCQSISQSLGLNVKKLR